MADATLCSAILEEGPRDAQGTLHLPDPEARIVCLVPSITELLCDLGLAARIIGRTGFCVHPEHLVRVIPKVGGTKDVNLARVRRLAPSHLIVNIDENEKPTVQALAAAVPHIVVTHPQHPRDNLELYRLMGSIFCVEPRAAMLCAQFEEAYERLEQLPWQSRRVLYLIWKDPWMTVAPGTYIANMLALVDWQHLSFADTRRYPEIDLDKAAQQAELILLSSEPYRFDETHRAALAKRFPEQHVQLVDGEMLSWYGSRAIAGLDYLSQLAGAGRAPAL
jgi:ABC-type Fe3+-hydroxamate transport system substrate-binding protein